MRADILQDIDRDDHREIGSRDDLQRTLSEFAAWTSSGA